MVTSKNVDARNYSLWRNFLMDTPKSYSQWFADEKVYLDRHIDSDGNVLDVGCGEGRSLRYLLDKNLSLYGIDHNLFAIREGRDRLVGRENVTMMIGDARDICFRDGFFDYVLAISVPANFGKHKAKIYSEMSRVLKPNGELVLSCYNNESETFRERMRVYESIGAPIEKVEGTTVFIKSRDEDWISEQYSREKLGMDLDKNGFVSVDMIKEGIGLFCRARKK